MWWLHLTFHPKKGHLMTRQETAAVLIPYTKVAYVSDKEYTTAYKKDIKKFLEYNIFRHRKFVPEKYDCDNYSFVLQGLMSYGMSGYAIGIVWVHTPKGNHALNFFIDEMEQMWYIEPQSNEIFQRKDYEPYLFMM